MRATPLDRAAHAVAHPTRTDERLPWLDAVRGMALGGILLANLTSFFGVDMLGAEARLAMPAGVPGEYVLFAINWLVEGKFYSIFSILLGVGFALQARWAAARATPPEAFARFFRRRMLVLGAFGITHMYMLWSGDILTLYAVMGLLLPSLLRLSPAVRTALMLALFTVPLATHAAVVASDGRYDPRPPFAAAGAGVRERLGAAGRPALQLFAQGTAADYLRWNIANAVVRPGTYLQSGRPAKVIALFLLGVWIGTTVLPRLGRLRRSLVATVIAGGLVGLASSAVYAGIKGATGSTFLVSPTGLLQTAAYTFGTTPLALAYLAAAALGWNTTRGRSVLEWFVPLGRMALSVYLTQSIVQLAVFSGYGLGLAGRVPVIALPLVAAVILVTQRRLCAWWLRRHAHGPLEWIWRRATYGRVSAHATTRPSAGASR